MSSKKPTASPNANAPPTPEEASMLMQVLQAQSNMQALLLEGFSFSYEACTSASTLPQLSARERRCIQQGVALYIDARSHIAQHVAQTQKDSGKDF
jgi:hypothetical protein